MRRCWFFWHDYEVIKSGYSATQYKCTKCDRKFWDSHLI